MPSSPTSPACNRGSRSPGQAGRRLYFGWTAPAFDCAQRACEKSLPMHVNLRIWTTCVLEKRLRGRSLLSPDTGQYTPNSGWEIRVSLGLEENSGFYGFLEGVRKIGQMLEMHHHREGLDQVTAIVLPPSRRYT